MEIQFQNDSGQHRRLSVNTIISENLLLEIAIVFFLNFSLSQKINCKKRFSHFLFCSLKLIRFIAFSFLIPCTLLLFPLISLIDHGDGLIALRVLNPLAIDSGFYTCMVASEYGCCSTSCEVIIREAEEVVRETIPAFIDEPVPVVAMHGSVVSFCGRVSPAAAKVKWFVCGREITESSRGTIVSQTHMLCIRIC